MRLIYLGNGRGLYYRGFSACLSSLRILRVASKRLKGGIYFKMK